MEERCVDRLLHFLGQVDVQPGDLVDDNAVRLEVRLRVLQEYLLDVLQVRRKVDDAHALFLELAQYGVKCKDDLLLDALLYLRRRGQAQRAHELVNEVRGAGYLVPELAEHAELDDLEDLSSKMYGCLLPNLPSKTFFWR